MGRSAPITQKSRADKPWCFPEIITTCKSFEANPHGSSEGYKKAWFEEDALISTLLSSLRFWGMGKQQTKDLCQWRNHDMRSSNFAGHAFRLHTLDATEPGSCRSLWGEVTHTTSYDAFLQETSLNRTAIPKPSGNKRRIMLKILLVTTTSCVLRYILSVWPAVSGWHSSNRVCKQPIGAPPPCLCKLWLSTMPHNMNLIPVWASAMSNTWLDACFLPRDCNPKQGLFTC